MKQVQVGKISLSSKSRISVAALRRRQVCYSGSGLSVLTCGRGEIWDWFPSPSGGWQHSGSSYLFSSRSFGERDKSSSVKRMWFLDEVLKSFEGVLTPAVQEEETVNGSAVLILSSPQTGALSAEINLLAKSKAYSGNGGHLDFKSCRMLMLQELSLVLGAASNYLCPWPHTSGKAESAITQEEWTCPAQLCEGHMHLTVTRGTLTGLKKA